MKVTTHPLAEIIAKKLFSIESVPPEEARRMVGMAIKAAITYHQHEINKLYMETGDKLRAKEIEHEIDMDIFNKIISEEYLKGNQYLNPNFD